MKLRSLNLASGSTMPSPILRVKILPQKWYGLGHMTLLKILNPLKYFWNDVATLIKFGEWINYGKSGVKFSPWKGHGLVHFSNGWGYPVGKWIDYSRSRSKGKIIPQKGHGMGHMIILGMKPRSLNFANASAMASATPGVKNSASPPETGVVSVTWLLFNF